MATSQAEGIISELRGDPFARTILDRVEAGPYGPGNRGRSATDPDTFYATIMGTSDNAVREDRRIRRQSRLTREIVSIEGVVACAFYVAHALIRCCLDSNILANPTPEWQEGLIRRLAGGAVPAFASSQSPASIAASRSPISDSSSSLHGADEPRTRRRLEGSYLPPSTLPQQSVAGPSNASYSNWDELDDTVDSFGHLALDDMKEV